eukprot:3932159-Rhodomonas_salina.1
MYPAGAVFPAGYYPHSTPDPSASCVSSSRWRSILRGRPPALPLTHWCAAAITLATTTCSGSAACSAQYSDARRRRQATPSASTTSSAMT